MRVAEIYPSIQGEGLYTGTPSVFLRTSGCNLRCSFCDTPFTSWFPQGHDFSVPELLEQISAWPLGHTVITGGEPMLFSELVPLCDRLTELGKTITIETAGTLYLPLQCDLMSISPKLGNSTPTDRASAQWIQRHEQTRLAPEVIRRLTNEHQYQIKFVVSVSEDVSEIEGYLAAYDYLDRSRVMLMPEGTTTERLRRIGEWLEPKCQELGVRFCPRKQIAWFGNQRRT